MSREIFHLFLLLFRRLPSDLPINFSKVLERKEEVAYQRYGWNATISTRPGRSPVFGEQANQFPAHRGFAAELRVAGNAPALNFV